MLQFIDILKRSFIKLIILLVNFIISIKDESLHKRNY